METVHSAAQFTTGIGLTHPSSLLFLIPLLPVLGAVVNGILGSTIQARFGKKAVHGIAIGAMVIARRAAKEGAKRANAA